VIIQHEEVKGAAVEDAMEVKEVAAEEVWEANESVKANANSTQLPVPGARWMKQLLGLFDYGAHSRLECSFVFNVLNLLLACIYTLVTQLRRYRS
jgi:hypothetical protein